MSSIIFQKSCIIFLSMLLYSIYLKYRGGIGIEKLKELRNKAGIKQSELASILNVANTTISNWENDISEPDRESLIRLSDYFNVSVDCLLDRDIYQHAFDNILSIETKKISLLGEIACGEPIFASEDFESYVECGAEIRADFALRCKGDSMINARVQDGDIVFIRSRPDVENGEIAAVIIDDEATLKRVYKKTNSLILMAENPAYEPMVYTGSELEQVRILGKAIAFQSDIK